MISFSVDALGDPLKPLILDARRHTPGSAEQVQYTKGITANSARRWHPWSNVLLIMLSQIHFCLTTDTTSTLPFINTSNCLTASTKESYLVHIGMPQHYLLGNTETASFPPSVDVVYWSKWAYTKTCPFRMPQIILLKLVKSLTSRQPHKVTSRRITYSELFHTSSKHESLITGLYNSLLQR